jgi:hypothetical protein
VSLPATHDDRKVAGLSLFQYVIVGADAVEYPVGRVTVEYEVEHAAYGAEASPSEYVRTT